MQSPVFIFHALHIFVYNFIMPPPLALVTGGAKRLGKAFALHLARLGYSIALHYNTSEEEARQTKREIESIGVQVHLLQADLSQPKEITRLFSNLQPLTLNLLVNSAAVMSVGNPRELSSAEWDSTLDLNLRAPFFLSQRAARMMTSGGLIINISDIAAHKSWTRYPAYTVSKAGLESLTQILARALAPSIRVNAIAPGLVLPSDVVTEEGWGKLVERLPLQRAATLDEITSALEFLIKNEYITGQTITVDGGYSLL
jgi:NAD(P)-dependent dehydrogenase (short-subunit alcohol dehydrogenase family)